MQIINLFGGPNSGKSTTAAGLFYHMKSASLSAELVTEYAKDMVWENRQAILDDQLYILAKQHRRLKRLAGKVDWVITDSPLLLGLVYAGPETPKAFGDLLRQYWNLFDNLSFYLPRNHDYKFHREGRAQRSHEQAVRFDERIQKIMPEDVVTLTTKEYVSEILVRLGIAAPPSPQYVWDPEITEWNQFINPIRPK